MTKGDREWLSDAASLGCLICRRLGYGETPAEIHHIRTGIGKGQRASHRQVIPLCPLHHRIGSEAYHTAPATWQEKYGSELDLVEQTVREVLELRQAIIGRQQ